jgi:hypothetical protein
MSARMVGAFSFCVVLFVGPGTVALVTSAADTNCEEDERESTPHYEARSLRNTLKNRTGAMFRRREREVEVKDKEKIQGGGHLLWLSTQQETMTEGISTISRSSSTEAWCAEHNTHHNVICL